MSGGYFDLGDCNLENVRAEFGSTGDVRFLDPENVRVYDREGNVINCKCGKPAGSAAMGKEEFVAWCADCSPLNQTQGEFVYKSRTQEKRKEYEDMGFLVHDLWEH